MKISIHKLFVTALFVGFLSLSPSFAKPALACSCFSPPAARLVRDATTIIAGRAISSDSRFGVRFQVFKVWKGKETEEVTLDRPLLDCGPDFSADRTVIVFASGSVEKPQPIVCSQTPAMSEVNVREMDALLGPHKQLADDVQPCESTGRAAAELRVTASRTDHTPIPEVQIVIEKDGGRFSAVTNGDGKAVFSNLTGGEYKITAYVTGFAPKRLTAEVAPGTCAAPSLSLLRNP
jgi:hypothetical protein